MLPIRKGDGTGLSVPGYSEVRKGDGTVLWSAGGDIPDSALTQVADHIWYMDEGSGSTFEDEVGGADASLNFSTWESGAGVGEAYPDFDGADDTANCGNVFDTQSDLTISFWAKPQDVSGAYLAQQGVVGDGERFFISLENGTFNVDFAKTNFDSSGTPDMPSYTIDTWQLFTIVLDSGTCRVYLDDSEVASFSASAPEWNSGDPFTIGNREDDARPWEDGIDFGIVSYQAATETEISDHYTQTQDLYNDIANDSGNKTLSTNAGYTWHQDPRAYHYDGVTYFGYVTNSGDVEAGAYDHSDGTVETTTLNANLVTDDHVAPSLHIRPDERIIYFYARESSQVRYRISTDPLDISSFDSEQTFSTSSKANYPKPTQLPSESERMYLFYRLSSGDNYQEYYRYSDDDGATWQGETQLTDFGANRAYLKTLTDDPKIHISIHRANLKDTGDTDFVSYMYYDDGAFYDASGSEIATEGELPITASDLTEIYTAPIDGEENQLRVRDLAIDDSGNPVIVFGDHSDPDNHELYYAKHDGGSWSVNSITTAGPGVDDLDGKVQGGMAIDQTDTSTIWLTQESDTDQFDLYRAETSDGGASWDFTQLTDDSNNLNWLPFSVRNPSSEMPVCYLRGEWNDYDDFDQELLGRVQ